MGRIIRQSRRRYHALAILLTTAAATLLPAAAARGASKFITGYAHVDNYVGSADYDQATLSLYSIGGRTGEASAYGSGSASFGIYTTTAGAGTVSGQSDVVTWPEYQVARRSTQADGYVQIADFFRVMGNVENPFVNFKVETWGTLKPNAAFESAWNAANPNAHINTAWVEMMLQFGPTDSQGNFIGLPTNYQKMHDSSAASNDFIMDYKKTFEAPPQTFFGFSLVINGFGQMGGGFDCAGLGGARSAGLQSDSAGDGTLVRAADAGSLANGFFEIVVELPPGLSLSGQSGLVSAVTIPEPSAALPLLAALLTSTRLRRRPIIFARIR